MSFAMFPLGSVLFPHMPLALRVFEERYLVMMSRVLSNDPKEFGVVLLESGHEAGATDMQRRFRFGTVAEITELGATDGNLAVLARGGRRIEVVEWLDDDPHPVAVVREVPELEWDESLEPMRAQAELIVRRTIARASEFVELPWDADVELSDDPVVCSWQLAGIAPLTPLDQISLLQSTSARELLMKLIEFTHGAGEVLTTSWLADDDLDDELVAEIERASRERGAAAATAADDESDDADDADDAASDPTDDDQGDDGVDPDQNPEERTR